MEVKDLMQIADINGFVIKPEKSNRKLVFNRIFNKNFVEISLYATIWNKKEHNKYKKLKGIINMSHTELKKLKYEELKRILLTDILKQVIKKDIMML